MLIIIKISQKEKYQMSNVKFKQSTGEVVEAPQLGQNSDYVDMEVIALVPGTFVNSTDSRDVVISEDDVMKLHDNYNERVGIERKKVSRRLKRTLGMSEPILEAPVHKDHDLSQESMVGRVLNEMRLVKEDDQLQLRATIRVLTKKYVEHATAQLFKKVSIAFDPENHFISEISFVPYGSVDAAERVSYKKSDSEKPVQLTKLQKTSNQYFKLKKEYDNIALKYKVKKMTTAFKKSGRLKPIEANRLEADFLSMSSHADREVAFRMINGLIPKGINFKLHSRNHAARAMEKMMLSSNEEQERVVSLFAKHIKKDPKAAFSKSETPVVEAAEEVEEKDSVSIAKDDCARFSAMLNEGDLDGCKKFFSELSGDTVKDSEEDDEKAEDETCEMKELSAQMSEIKTQLSELQENMTTLSALKETVEEASSVYNQLKSQITSEEE